MPFQESISNTSMRQKECPKLIRNKDKEFRNKRYSMHSKSDRKRKALISKTHQTHPIKTAIYTIKTTKMRTKNQNKTAFPYIIKIKLNKVVNCTK
jgi:hypothetical protein